MNYTNILQKCIKELKEEKPKIDYVLGMLEVLSEMSDKPLITQTQPAYETKPNFIPAIPTSSFDETTPENIPDFLKPGAKRTL